MFIDSHCHLDLLEINALNAYKQAQDKKVTSILAIGLENKTWDSMLEKTKDLAGVYHSIGIHPCYVHKSKLDKLEQYLKLDTVIATGETGLDYFHSQEHKIQQQESFNTHIELASKYQKPLIVHTRGARDDTLNMLNNKHAQDAQGIIHCFSEDYDFAKKAIDLGFYISISGIVTFKNAKALQEIVAKLPLECLLIETDAPYLAPMPYRGKSNLPEYVIYVAQKIAEIKGITLEEVAMQTSNNFKKLFNL